MEHAHGLLSFARVRCERGEMSPSLGVFAGKPLAESEGFDKGVSRGGFSGRRFSSSTLFLGRTPPICAAPLLFASSKLPSLTFPAARWGDR